MKIITQLNRRFSQQDTSIISSLAVLGLRGISFVAKDKLPGHGKDKLQHLCETYGTLKRDQQPYINGDQTKHEWDILKPLVIQQKYPTDNIYTLWKILYKHDRDLIPNLIKLAELALIAPLQTADCERGFSTQNDIKTADRNRLSSDRLNKLMRISLQKDRVTDFDFTMAVREWKSTKDRRAFKHTF